MNIKKLILIISFALNMTLIFLSFFFYNKMNEAKESAANEIQLQFIAIETAIGNQMQTAWTEVEDVDKQLQHSLMTISRSVELIDELSIGSKKEFESSFINVLKTYKRNNFFDNNHFTSQGIAYFEKLRSILREEGFGKGIAITMNDYKVFITKIDALNTKLSDLYEE
ncbi:hypothetical protein ACIQXI_04735 [Lysinibacillus sp. NPDC097195]|uniref:hypothetical protein n=1 Tax=Lysinibacillus sp. NPDC097195 TaxID=3364141 RepID=UPI003802B55E